jgi:hypothetical protein
MACLESSARHWSWFTLNKERINNNTNCWSESCEQKGTHLNRGGDNSNFFPDPPQNMEMTILKKNITTFKIFKFANPHVHALWKFHVKVVEFDRLKNKRCRFETKKDINCGNNSEIVYLKVFTKYLRYILHIIIVPRLPNVTPSPKWPRTRGSLC